MKTFTDFWRKRFGQSATGHTVIKHRSYDLGDEWTPTHQQIIDARKRQKARRANAKTRWRRLKDGADFDAARTVIICAAERVEGNDPDTAQLRRAIRTLALESDTKIFVRNMRVSPDRYLIEFRHPRLIASDSRTPLGLRFIGLSADAWSREDQVGVFLDGSEAPVRNIFARNFEATVHDVDLAEIYVRFAFDHVTFGEDQLYVISDRHDFIQHPPLADASRDTLLVAQFRVTVPPSASGAAARGEGAVLDALRLPHDALIPPTTLRVVESNGGIPAYAVVFATVIFRAQLYHVCFTVSADGKIRPSGAEHRRTPDNVTLPLMPLRSFGEQRAVLKRAIGDDARRKP